MEYPSFENEPKKKSFLGGDVPDFGGGLDYLYALG